MYIKTPRRYRGTARRQVFSMRRFAFIVISLALITGGIYLIQNADSLRGDVEQFISQTLRDVERQSATLVAPPPTATPDPRGTIAEADNFWTTGALGEAVPRYQQILGSVPNDVELHYRVVFGLMALGDAESAVPYAERAVTADPFSSDAWAIRAWALNGVGRTGEAIASGLQAVELDPRNPRALAYLADAYFSAGQNERAQTLASQAIELDAGAFEGYWVRGRVREEGLFLFDSAMEDYRNAYDIASTRQPVALGLAAVEIAQMEIRNQNYDSAIATLDDVLENNPENALALFWMGTVYFSFKGDPSTASSYLLRCVDYNPNSYNCLYLLGRSQFALEQIQVASESFDSAIRAGSPFARHYWWAANAHFALGDCARAVDYLEDGFALLTSDTPTELRDAYDYLGTTCGASFRSAPVLPSPTPEAESTPAPEGET